MIFYKALTLKFFLVTKTEAKFYDIFLFFDVQLIANIVLLNISALFKRKTYQLHVKHLCETHHPKLLTSCYRRT